MTTVLLTGATGYLGSHLLRRLCADPDSFPVVLKRSHSDTHRIANLLPFVRSYDVDREGVEQAFRDQNIDLVAHLATHYCRHEVSSASIAESNILFPLKLLDAALEHGVSGFLYTHTTLPPVIGPYALSKHQFVEWMRLASSQMICISAAIEHFYGPGDNASRFITYVVRTLLRGEPVLRLTEGKQRRDFIFVDDVTSALSVLLGASRQIGPGWHEFEVGTGQTISVADLVRLIANLTGNQQTHLDFGALPYRTHEVMDSFAQTRFLEQLGWRSRFDLKSGLERTIRLEQEKMQCTNVS